MWTKYSLIKSTVNLQISCLFSSKIERLPRGGGLEGSTLPSKNNLFSPLYKGVFINTLVGGGWVGESVCHFFLKFQKRGDQREIKPVWGAIRNFKREKRVILGAKSCQRLKKLRSSQFYVTIIVDMSYFQIKTKYNQWKKLLEMFIVIKAKYEWNLYLFLQNFLTLKDSLRQPYILKHTTPNIMVGERYKYCGKKKRKNHQH